MYLHEDNTTCISCLRSGINRTMKTLERGFGIDIAWNHKRIESGDYVLVHTRTSHMSADIYTKGLGNPKTWMIPPFPQFKVGRTMSVLRYLSVSTLVLGERGRLRKK